MLQHVCSVDIIKLFIFYFLIDTHVVNAVLNFNDVLGTESMIQLHTFILLFLSPFVVKY